MLRIIAMVGDAEASAHLRAGVEDVARLKFVRDARALSQHNGRDLPDVLVLGVKEVEPPDVGVVVRNIIARQPGIRVFLVCQRDGPNVHALARVQRLDYVDVILPRDDSHSWTRHALLDDNPAELADRCVRRLVCSGAPEWVLRFVHWCVDHDGTVRPNVRALAAVARVRPETLVRRFAALGGCLPNHLISWVLVLRARARLDRPRARLEAVAHELGLASGGSLANLIRRRTGLTPLEFRARKLDELAATAVQEMFGACAECAVERPPRFSFS